MIDYSKYKRVFAFGCSFTRYQFPTWADLFAKEMSHCEYYNFGTAGSGNLLISNRIAQANCQFNFCETDLVLVMFTTAAREDRYIDGEWRTKGNVYSQDYYNDNFVKNYCDPDGFIIRDLGLIQLVKGYLNNLPCKSIYFSMGDLQFESIDYTSQHHPKTLSFEARMNQLFNGTLDDILPSVISTMGRMNGFSYINNNGEKCFDAHPGTKVHCEYLLKVGIPLSQSTIDYAHECQNKIESITYIQDLQNLFPELQKDYIHLAKMM